MTKPPADREPGDENRRESLPREPERDPEEETRLSPLSPPARVVGQYRLRERVGGGGMGVIYRAHDTRLGRAVALKLLPPELARDRTAKVRFIQEARAASALDHPNLCTIYDAGEIDGQLYLAMPLYEGETLRDRLARGALPIEEAVDVARQIAQGLAKAHRQGILHRDVKPANLMLTSDGVVKILDFGLAKLIGEAGITRTGIAIGSPAYMSPEQARGAAVDHRTDLWSLGAVLYEMVTGHRAFPGDQADAIFYGILHREPEPLARLRPDAPAELERMIAGLLAKDPEKRYPGADAVAAELRKLQGVSHASLQTLATAAAAARGRSIRLWIGGALTLAALLAAAGLLLRSRWGTEDASDAAPPQPTFTQLTDLPGSELFPSLHPSGDFFVYVKSVAGNEDVYLQRVGGGNPINLTADSPAADTQPAYSPDGQRIAFRSERDGGGIFVMGATGESVHRLADFGYSPAWSPDGRELAVATEGVADPAKRFTESQIWRVDVATGNRQLVVRGDAVQPSWSPSGVRIAYWSIPSGTARRVIWTASADGKDPVQVTDDAYVNWNPVWSPDGRFLYFGSDRGGSMNMWRVPIDEASGRVLGEPQPVTTPARWSGLMSLAKDGRRILYATQEGSANLERADFDPGPLAVVGSLVPVTRGSRRVGEGKVSPDGLWVVFAGSSPQEDLFIVRSDGSALRQLTRDIAKDRGPSWSPDSRQILFYSNRDGRYEPWTVRPDGSELRKIPVKTDERILSPVWAPDGKRFFCTLDLRTVAVVDLTQPPEQRIPERLPAAPAEEPFFTSSVSADGKRLAGNIGSLGMFLFSLDSRQYERLGDGEVPMWMSDDQRLLYLWNGKVFAMDTRTKRPRELLAPPEGSTFNDLDVSSDDRTLFVVRIAEEGDIWTLSLY